MRRVIHGILGRLRGLEQVSLGGEHVRSRRIRSIARWRAVVTSQAPRVGGNAVAGPALGRDDERFLTGLLGEVEVAEEADQGGQDASPLVAEDLLDQEPISTIGRTSTEPPMRAAGILAATSMRRVEVGGLEQVVAGEDLLGVGERPIGGQRLPVLDADRGGRLDRLQLLAADDARACR